MDRSKRDLEAVVASQKEQLGRYEKRLKDVVTAYKGLLKEKEALETSLNAITNKSTESAPSSEVTTVQETKNDETITEDKENLQTQILTLMSSLATLSAEKSRMEASFQADKKQLRAQLQQKDQQIADLQQQQKLREESIKMEVEEMRAKWIIERQDREKETNNQMLMIRELQKLYADERHLKENIEMQLNNFKTQFASKEAEHSRLNELQQKLKEANMQLQKLQNSDMMNETNADNKLLLQQLQTEMQHLKEQHAIALKNEQRRVKLAEEQSRQQAAVHEERVTNLEARLAELSNSVGKYDRLRQQDQQNIQELKRQLQDLEREGQKGSLREPEENPSLAPHDIVEQILHLKKLLLQTNTDAANPFNMSKLFVGHTDHVQCQEELANLQQQYDIVKTEIARMQDLLEVKNSHITTLQDKVRVLNRNIDDQEAELKSQQANKQEAIKEERAKWQQIINDRDNEYRVKVNDLEQQLLKQRQRSLQLLDEKQEELKTLKNSFEIFHTIQLPKTAANPTNSALTTDENKLSTSSENESYDEMVKHGNINAKKLSVGENCTVLHYANELARKDKEISTLRKAKNAADNALRKAIHEKVSVQEQLNDKIEYLEQQVDRLQRCITREGANLEYLKNVIISFIVTRDAEGKRHMLNAISAVLQFTPSETQTINAVFQKK